MPSSKAVDVWGRLRSGSVYALHGRQAADGV
jgi:hypothetical protein